MQFAPRLASAMHELAITQGVVDQISERLGDAKVTRVALEIGRLSGVVCDSVRFCFDVCAQGTTLEGARLEIIQTAGCARCRECGACFGVDDLLALCRCGSADLELIAGQELKIREVELADV
ncbi:MAG TPA: hydrogenase maturation nickel metallochaperone HypA [Candidatus Binataceae bacterium]|nr:hydrogenase maturation nickel metallochaperone HypA [Candidatus Binataceae bacterium]